MISEIPISENITAESVKAYASKMPISSINAPLPRTCADPKPPIMQNSRSHYKNQVKPPSAENSDVFFPPFLPCLPIIQRNTKIARQGKNTDIQTQSL
jgi:hypothetical protein